MHDRVIVRLVLTFGSNHQSDALTWTLDCYRYTVLVSVCLVANIPHWDSHTPPDTTCSTSLQLFFCPDLRVKRNISFTFKKKLLDDSPKGKKGWLGLKHIKSWAQIKGNKKVIGRYFYSSRAAMANSASIFKLNKKSRCRRISGSQVIKVQKDN